MSKKKIGVVFGAVIFAAIVAVGIWYFFGGAGRDSNDRVYVEKVSVIMGTATGAQNRYSGVVQPQKTVEINADSDRSIGEVLVSVGDVVEEGTPLFSYDTEELSMDLEQAELELENQDIEISSYKNQISELEKEKAQVPAEEQFEYTTEIQTLETQIKQAEFEKSSKQLEIDKIEKQIENSEVVSTASGTVKTINDDQSISEGEDSSAFITILSMGEYRVKGTVNEQNIWMLSEGDEVIVRSRVDEETTWTGTIESIDEEEPSNSSADSMYVEGEMGDETTVSSKYPFYVAIDDAEGLMLGQHVLIELDEGQMEERDGIWLYSSYLVFDEDMQGSAESLTEGTESFGGLSVEDIAGFAGTDKSGAVSDLSDLGNLADIEGMEALEGLEGTETLDGIEFFDQEEMGEGMEAGEDSDYAEDDTDDWGYEDESEYEDSTEMPQEMTPQTAYVWADDGTGHLEKRKVELGEYDEELDEYEILSGLTEEDYIAWPMEGLYEGVKTVTDMEEIDYSSGLYNQGTEGMWYDSESGMMDDMMMDDMMMEDVMIDDVEMYDEEYDEEFYDEGTDDELTYADELWDTEVSE